MATSSRMLTLLSLLQARRDWPAQRLAARLEVSERTVRRDIDRLRELGYRIHAVMGPDGGYRLEAGSELPPLLFDDEQAVVLALALQSLEVGGSGLEDAAGRALATVRQLMPSRLRHRVDAVRVTAIRQGGAPVDAEVLATLGGAIRDGVTLRFDYGGSPRRAEPHRLVARGGRTYLLAWDLDRDDWRTFRVDRVLPRVPHGPRFREREIPGGDAAAFVAARFKGSQDADAWPCVGEAILSVPARDVLPYIGDGTVEALDDGRCRVILGSWSWIGLAASLGMFDADVEVVGPPELADGVATLARRMSSAASSA